MAIPSGSLMHWGMFPEDLRRQIENRYDNAIVCHAFPANKDHLATLQSHRDVMAGNSGCGLIHANPIPELYQSFEAGPNECCSTLRWNSSLEVTRFPSSLAMTIDAL